MIKQIQNLAKITALLLFANSYSHSQTIINNGNLTISGLFAPAAPIIDGEINDLCWTSATVGGDPNPNRFQSGAFPNLLTKFTNLNDGGTASGSVPAAPGSGSLPVGISSSFSLVWDLDYLYFCVKVVDSRILPKTAVGSMNNNTGIELFFNNGNGVSSFLPGGVNWPSNLSASKDMQTVFNVVNYSTEKTAILPPYFQSPAGITLGVSGYEAAYKGTPDGYIMEGKISWKVINKEFIDASSEQYILPPAAAFDSRPDAGRRALRFDIGANIPLDDFTSRLTSLTWNQCCWNTNWTQSQHYGTLLLTGSFKVFPPTSVSILNAAPIATSGSNLQLTASVLPADAPQSVSWSVSGSSGGYPIATINESGVLKPLNNGTVTITASTLPFIYITTTGVVTVPSVITTATLVITNQLVPTSIIISAATITANWGNSGSPSASVLPTGAPNLVSWSLINPSTGPVLAKMNTLTGEVTSTALASGSVTIVGTSLANGITGSYVLPIINQDPVSCFAVAAYTNVALGRTKNALTFSAFNTGVTNKTKVILNPEYINKNIITATGYASSAIPNDLVSIVGVFGSSGSGQITQSGGIYSISFNQPALSPVTITAIYLNDPTIRTTLVASYRNSGVVTTTPSGFCSYSSGYDIRRSSTAALQPGCNTSPMPADAIICSVTGISDVLSESKFDIYPNPASESVTISADGLSNVSISNLVGSELISTSVSGTTTTISTSSLDSGVYFVKVTLRNGQSSLPKKLLISK